MLRDDPGQADAGHRLPASDGSGFAARRVAGNFAALVSGEVIARFLSLASIAWLTRSLGVEGFGLLSFGLAVAAYGVLVGRAGLDLWGTREAARGDNLPQLAGQLMVVRGPVGLAAFLLTLAFAAAQPNGAARPALVILATLILVDTASLTWIFLGREQMRLVALATNLNMALVAGAVLLFVRDSSDVELVALLTVGGEVVGAALLLWVFLHRYGRPHLRVKPALSRAMLLESMPFAAISILSIVRYNFDIVLIGLLLGGTQTGLYSAPYRILAFLISIVAAYFTALLPALARCYVSDPPRGYRLVEQSARIVAIFVLPTAVGGTILAKELVTLLFGPAFEQSAPVFRVLIWALVPLCLALGYRNLFRAYNQQSVEMRAVAWGAAVNVALNLLLVPIVGLLGAAVATAVGELVLLGACWRAARGLAPRSITPRNVLRPLVPALGMGAVLVALPSPPLVVSIAVGPLVYFPLLFLMGGISRVDLRELRAELPRAHT